MLHSVLVIGRLCVASTISTLRMIPMMSQSRTVHCVGRKKGRRVAEGRKPGGVGCAPQRAQPRKKTAGAAGMIYCGRTCPHTKGRPMLNDLVLLNDWHVVAYAPDLKEGRPMAVRLLEEELVLWRVGDRILAWRDLCLHRGTRLSLGKIENN